MHSIVWLKDLLVKTWSSLDVLFTLWNVYCLLLLLSVFHLSSMLCLCSVGFIVCLKSAFFLRVCVFILNTSSSDLYMFKSQLKMTSISLMNCLISGVACSTGSMYMPIIVVGICLYGGC